MVVCATYAGTLENGFHYDDMHSIVENPHIRSTDNLARFFVDPGMFSGESRMRMYRPLLLVTYAVNYAVHGYDPLGYHLVSVGLHCLVVLLVFGLLRQHASTRLAWWGAALFGVHPIHTQTVNYLSCRSELLATLAVVATVSLYRHASPGRPWALLAHAAGLLCKSTAVVVAPLLVLRESEAADRWRRWRNQWPFWGITGAYIILIHVNGFLQASLSQDVRPYAAQLSAQIKAVALYLKLLIVPLGLSVEHQFHAGSLSWAEASSGALAVSLLVLGVVRARGVVRWGLGWYVLGSALTFVVPLNVLVSEHRLYLPSIGMVVALTGVLATHRPPRALRLLGGGVLLLLAVLSWQRSQVWRDDLSLWRDAAEQAPTMFRAQSNWGLALYDAGQLAAAETVLERSLALNPGYARTWNNLGLVHEERGALPEAEAAFEHALALDPGLVSARVNLGHLLLRLGRDQEALRLLQQAAVQAPASVLAWTQLGVALQRLGDLAGARQAYAKALAMDARSADAWNDLGLLELAENAVSAARSSFQRALEIDPQHIQARINLRGLVLRGQGVPRLEACRRVAREFPDQADVWVALAQAQAAAGSWDSAAVALKQALERSPDPALRLQLGGALRHAGRLGEAISVYTQALRTAPGSIALHNALTAAYAAAGRRREALESCRQALALDPQDALARRHLRRLRTAPAEGSQRLTPP